MTAAHADAAGTMAEDPAARARPGSLVAPEAKPREPLPHPGDSRAASEPLLDVLLARATLWGERAALSILRDGRWESLSYLELHRRAHALSDALIEDGVAAGDRIAIVSEPRPEWAVAFFAAIRAGAVVVPLDPKLPPEELQALVADARPRVVLVSSRLASAVAPVAGDEGRLLLLDGDAGGRRSIAALQATRPQAGRERALADTGLIVYTSGTTGRPRGVRIGLGSLRFEAESLCHQIPIAPGEVFLSMLPLNHLLELTGGLLCVLWSGGEVCYGQTLLPSEMARIIAERRVTQMVTVPLFLRLLRAEIERAIRRAGPLAVASFRLARLAAGLMPSLEWRRRLFGAVHRRLGGRLRRFVVGGSPLDPATERFFEQLGIELCQGYGLTECSPVVSVNPPGARRRGSVGRPLPGVEVHILSGANGGAEGEILTRGPHLMQGYLDGADSPIDAEGWLHTGDRGRIDADGYLYVTGRLKDLIALASGKKVQPEEVEAALLGCAEFREVCVVGSRAREGLLEGTEEVCAVVVPAAAGASPEAIRREVERLTARLAPHKRPSRVELHPGPLPRSVAHKVQRQRLQDWLAAGARG